MKQHSIEVDTARCVGCGLCQRDCAGNHIAVADGKAFLRDQNCMKCGHCVAICPKGAVSMTGFEEAPEEFREKAALDPAALLQAVKMRRSVRHFRPEAVPDETVRRILEAGRYTPTAKNLQNVSYVVLEKDRARYEGLAVAFFRKLVPFARLFMKEARSVAVDDHFFFKGAPLAILVVSSGSFAQVNGALAAADMALMAEAHGLGVLYSGFFSLAVNHFGSLRRALGLRGKDKVVTTLVLGTPNVQYRRTAQRDQAAVRRL